MRDPSHPDLSQRICLVAGASRGVGRGIARALGACGATVIVTGRSSESGAVTDGRRETIEETSRLVDLAGGRGFHYRCDHTSEREVDELVNWMRRRFGRIDLCAIAIWGGNEGYDGERYPDGSRFGTAFWRRPMKRLGHVLETGVYAQLMLARAVAPTMVAQKAGLIATVSFDTTTHYLGDAFYDLAKASMNRLSFIMAEELAEHGVTVVGLSPGFVRTERVRDAGLAEEATESPLYTGRALVALAADPDLKRHSGRILAVADLARLYGVQDEDGSQPEKFIPVSQGERA